MSLFLKPCIYILILFSAIQAQNPPWELLAQPTNKTLRKMDFINPQTGWAVGDTGLVMRTDDGGANWTIQSVAPKDNLIDVEFLNANSGWAIAPHRYVSEQDPAGTWLFQTTDGGASWDSTWFRDQLFWGMNFIDENTGWMGGEQGVLLGTTDGGQNWNEAVYEPGATTGFAMEHVSFVTPQIGYGVGGRFDLTSTIWSTVNGGATWRATNYGLEPMYDIIYLTDQHFITAGGDFDFGAAVLTTLDGGANWTYFYTGYWGQGRAIAARTDDHLFVPLGFAGTMMYTEDRGNTWLTVDNPDLTPIFDIVFFDSTNGLMIGGALDGDGKVFRYNPQLVALGETQQVLPPVSFHLESNYPNPFNPTTTIRFSQSERARVMLEVYSISGRKVALLINNYKSAGEHTVNWNGTNQRGEAVGSGVYLYRLTIGDETQTRKMVLAR